MPSPESLRESTSITICRLDCFLLIMLGNLGDILTSTLVEHILTSYRDHFVRAKTMEVIIVILRLGTLVV